MTDTDREENANPREDCIRRGECLKVILEQEFFTKKCLDTHKPYALAKRVGKCIQYIYCRGDPFCESVVTALGFAEPGNLFSKNSEDRFG